MLIRSSTLKQTYHTNRIARWVLHPLVVARNEILRVRDQPAVRVMDRLRNMAAEDICVRVEEFEGSFLLSPSSHLLHRLLVEGQYEPELARLARAHLDPERDAIDVGANVGFFSVLLGKRLSTGRVLSIEPSISASRRLQMNLARNQVPTARSIVFKGLVGSTDCQGELHVIDGMEEYSSAIRVTHHAAGGREARVENVRQATIDTLVRQHDLNPGFVKIDIEGFEMEALKGAEWTLKTFRPVILSELSDPLLRSNGSSSRQVVEFLEHLGYSVQDPLIQDARAGERAFGDLLAIPRNR